MPILTVPQLSDNYAYLVKSGANCAVVDPSEAAPVKAASGSPTVIGTRAYSASGRPDRYEATRK